MARVSAGAVDKGDICECIEIVSDANLYCKIIEGKNAGQTGLWWTQVDCVRMSEYPVGKRTLLGWLDKP